MKRYTILSLVAAMLILVGCTEDEIATHEFSEQQIAAKNLAGDWGAAFGIVAPDLESADALRDIKLLFTVDENGDPDEFLASDPAGATFGSEPGTWEWSNATTITEVSLTEVGPIKSFTITYAENIDIITIHFSAVNESGRKNGIGTYQLSLTRQ